MSDVVVNLVLNGQDFTLQVRQADQLIRRLGGTFGVTDRQARQFGNSLNGAARHGGHLVGTLRDLSIIGYTMSGVFLTMKQAVWGWQESIISANAQMEKMQVMFKGMSAASTELGQNKDAVNNLKEMIQLSKQAPFSIGEMTNALVKFKAVGLEAPTRAVKGLTDAVARFGGSDDIFHRASVAITQMAGKGVISMEELRQQLGEAVPNAINLMARSAGMSYKDFVDTVSQGSVQSGAAIQGLVTQIELSFGGSALNMMNTWTGMVNVMKSTWTEFLMQIGGRDAEGEILEDGYFDTARKELKALIDVIGSLEGQKIGYEIGQSLAFFVKSIGDAVRFVSSFSSEIAALGKAALIAFGAFKGYTILASVSAGFTALASSTSLVTIALGALSRVLMLNPFALIITAIGVAAAAFNVFGNSIGKVKDRIEELNEAGGNNIFTSADFKQAKEDIKSYTDEIVSLAKKAEEANKKVAEPSDGFWSRGPLNRARWAKKAAEAEIEAAKMAADQVIAQDNLKIAMIRVTSAARQEGARKAADAYADIARSGQIAYEQQQQQFDEMRKLGDVPINIINEQSVAASEARIEELSAKIRQRLDEIEQKKIALGIDENSLAEFNRINSELDSLTLELDALNQKKLSIGADATATAEIDAQIQAIKGKLDELEQKKIALSLDQIALAELNGETAALKSELKTLTQAKYTISFTAVGDIKLYAEMAKLVSAAETTEEKFGSLMDQIAVLNAMKLNPGHKDDLEKIKVAVGELSDEIEELITKNATKDLFDGDYVAHQVKVAADAMASMRDATLTASERTEAYNLVLDANSKIQGYAAMSADERTAAVLSLYEAELNEALASETAAEAAINKAGADNLAAIAANNVEIASIAAAAQILYAGQSALMAAGNFAFATVATSAFADSMAAIAGLTSINAGLNKDLEGLAGRLTEAKARAAEAAKRLEGFKGKAGGAAKASKGAAKAAKDQARETERLDKEMESLLQKLDPVRKSTEEIEKAQKLLNRALDQGAISSEEYEKYLKQVVLTASGYESAVNSLIKTYLPARAAAEEYAESLKAIEAGLASGDIQIEESKIILESLKKEQAEAAEQAKRDANKFYDAWQTGLEDLGQTFEDTFKDAVKNGRLELDSFGDWAKNWLANLAWSFAQQTLKVNVMGTATGGTGIMGDGGLTGDASTSIFSTGGMTSAVKNFTTLFGGNSVSSSIASMKLFGGPGIGASGPLTQSGASIAALPNWQVAGGGMVGGFASKMLFDFDSQAESVGHMVGSTAGTMIGTALAPMLGPLAPLGPLLGSFLGGSGGGFLGGLFGGDDKPKMQANIGTSMGVMRLGDTNDLSQEAVKALQDMLDQANAATASYGEALGSGAQQAIRDAMNGFSPVAQGQLGEYIAFQWSSSMAHGLSGAAYDAIEDGNQALADMFFAKSAEIFKITGDGNALVSEADAKRIQEIVNSALVEEAIIGLDQAGETVGEHFSSVMNDLMKGVDPTQIGAAVGQLTEYLRDFGESAESLVDFDTSTLEGAAVAFSMFFTEFDGAGESAAETMAIMTGALGTLQTITDATGESLDGLDVSQISDKAKDVWNYFDGLGASVEESMAIMSTAVGHLQMAADLTSTSIEGMDSETFAKLSKDMMGVTAATASYYENFFTEEERVAKQIEKLKPQVDSVFDDLEITVPETKAEFNALVQSIDLTTESGQDLYAALMGVAPAFAFVTDNLADVEATLIAIGVSAEDAKTISKDLVESSSLLESYYENFFTEEERVAAKIKSSRTEIVSVFDGLDIVVPESKAEFKALVDSIDKTTGSGMALFNALMEVGPAFAYVADNTKSITVPDEPIEPISYTNIESFLNDNQIVDYVATVNGINESIAAIVGDALPSITKGTEEWRQALVNLLNNGDLSPSQLEAINKILPDIIENLESLGSIDANFKWAEKQLGEGLSESDAAAQKLSDTLVDLGYEMPNLELGADDFGDALARLILNMSEAELAALSMKIPDIAGMLSQIFDEAESEISNWAHDILNPNMVGVSSKTYSEDVRAFNKQFEELGIDLPNATNGMNAFNGALAGMMANDLLSPNQLKYITENWEEIQENIARIDKIAQKQSNFYWEGTPDEWWEKRGTIVYAKELEGVRGAANAAGATMAGSISDAFENSGEIIGDYLGGVIGDAAILDGSTTKEIADIVRDKIDAIAGADFGDRQTMLNSMNNIRTFWDNKPLENLQDDLATALAGQVKAWTKVDLPIEDLDSIINSFLGTVDLSTMRFREVSHLVTDFLLDLENIDLSGLTDEQILDALTGGYIGQLDGFGKLDLSDELMPAVLGVVSGLNSLEGAGEDAASGFIKHLNTLPNLDTLDIDDLQSVVTDYIGTLEGVDASSLNVEEIVNGWLAGQGATSPEAAVQTAAQSLTAAGEAAAQSIIGASELIAGNVGAASSLLATAGLAASDVINSAANAIGAAGSSAASAISDAVRDISVDVNVNVSVDGGSSTTLKGPGYADGGIASGPTSGYAALLHGTEAIIPLKGGSIPVNIMGDALKINTSGIERAGYALKEAADNLSNSAESQRESSARVEKTLLDAERASRAAIAAGLQGEKAAAIWGGEVEKQRGIETVIGSFKIRGYLDDKIQTRGGIRGWDRHKERLGRENRDVWGVNLEKDRYPSSAFDITGLSSAIDWKHKTENLKFRGSAGEEKKDLYTNKTIDELRKTLEGMTKGEKGYWGMATSLGGSKDARIMLNAGVDHLNKQLGIGTEEEIDTSGQQKAISDLFKSIGMEAPKSLEELRDVFKNTGELTTEQANMLGANAPMLVEAMTAINAAASETANALEGLADALDPRPFSYYADQVRDAFGDDLFETDDWKGAFADGIPSGEDLAALIRGEYDGITLSKEQMKLLAENEEALKEYYNQLTGAENTLANLVEELFPKSEAEKADDLAKAFTEMGLTMPSTAQGLADLIGSGDLTAEQMIALAAISDELAEAFGETAKAASDALQNLADAYTVMDFGTLNDELSKSFADLGFDLPTTGEDFAAWYNDLDEATRKLVDEGLGESIETLEEYYARVEEMNDTLLNLAESLSPSSFADTKGRFNEMLANIGVDENLNRTQMADLLRGNLDGYELTEEQRAALAGNAGLIQDYFDKLATIRGLEADLLDAGGNGWEATLARREQELSLLGEEEAALKAAIWAEEDAMRVRNLGIELLRAQGDEEGALAQQRELERLALSEAERAIKEQIWALEDEARAREEALKLTNLEIELLNAQGKSWQATLLQRELELEGLSDEEVALKKLIWATEDANRIRDLEIELLNAQGKSWQATLIQRELELDALSDEEAALKMLIWATEDAMRVRSLEIERLNALGRSHEAMIAQREDEIRALSDFESAIKKQIWAIEDATKTRDLEIRLMQALGDETAALVAERQRELRGLSALDAAITRRIHAAEDAAKAAEEARQKESEALNEIISSTNEIISSLQNIFDTLDDRVKSLGDEIRKTATGTDAATRNLALADINRMIAGARSGNMPDADRVSEAVSGINFDPKEFATSEEMIQEQVAALNAMETLQDLVGDQKTIEEQMLESLEAQIEAIEGHESTVKEFSKREMAILNLLLGSTDRLSGHMLTNISRIDLNNDKIVDYEEFARLFAPIATDEEIRYGFNQLDLNGDGVISMLELNASATGGMGAYIGSRLGELQGATVTEDVFKQLFAPLASDGELSYWFAKLDTNGDGILSQEELANSSLSTIEKTLNAQEKSIRRLEELYGINLKMYQNIFIARGDTAGIRNNTSNIYQRLGTLSSISSGIGTMTSVLRGIARSSTSTGFATGGIASGPTSGYMELLHGTEAIIPLGDGNKITAQLSAPIPMPTPQPNQSFQGMISELQAVRSELADVKSELAESRQSAEIIGANQIGQLKEHNRRERKRDVIPQKVEST